MTCTLWTLMRHFTTRGPWTGSMVWIWGHSNKGMNYYYNIEYIQLTLSTDATCVVQKSLSLIHSTSKRVASSWFDKQSFVTGYSALLQRPSRPCKIAIHPSSTMVVPWRDWGSIWMDIRRGVLAHLKTHTWFHQTRKKGDLLIKNLWLKGTDSIHDMHLVNTDASFYH